MPSSCPGWFGSCRTNTRRRGVMPSPAKAWCEASIRLRALAALQRPCSATKAASSDSSMGRMVSMSEPFRIQLDDTHVIATGDFERLDQVGRHHQQVVGIELQLCDRGAELLR